MNKYDQNLDKNKANFVPLTPIMMVGKYIRMEEESLLG